MAETWLTDEEVEDATRRRQPAAQARVLKTWNVPFERRADGTLFVTRKAIEAARSGSTIGERKPASNGLLWSKRA